MPSQQSRIQRNINRRNRGRRGGANSQALSATHPNAIYSLGGEIPYYNTRPSVGEEIYTRVSSFELRAFQTQSTVAETFGALAIVPTTHINDFSSLAAVFDQYRMVRVEIWFTPRNVVVGNADAGLMTTVLDFDDASALASVGNANEYATALIGPGNLAHYRCWQPRAAVALYSGVFTSFGNLTSPWIDAASGSVQHYGFKSALTAGSGAVPWDLTLRTVSQWKSSR